MIDIMSYEALGKAFALRHFVGMLLPVPTLAYDLSRVAWHEVVAEIYELVRRPFPTASSIVA